MPQRRAWVVSICRAAGLVALVVLAACVAGRAQARGRRAPGPVHYTVTIDDPASQYVHVAMHVADPHGATSEVAMPAWTPGSYKIRDFARHVYDLRAEAAGTQVTVTRRDKQTWRVHHGGRPFTVHYRVFAADVGVRTSHISDRHASLVGTSVFTYVVHELHRPARVRIVAPADWKAFVALPSRSLPDGAVEIEASSYDALVDAPIELGTPHVEAFAVGDTQFQYVLTGADTLRLSPARLADDAERIVQAFATLMGSLPMKRYLFLMEVAAAGGGGLEHENSTSIILRPSLSPTDDGYLRAARVVAHEFFHAWNVKRIHDRVLGPFDYARENYSRLLWFHEGFTETMESLAMLRAGLVSPDDHLRQLGAAYTRYRAHPGRNHDPVSQMSFEAWTKGYQPADNHRNVAVSYYQKGDMIGVALDLELRLRSGGTGSLPGLFRRLMASHGAQDRGIVAADIVAAASAEAGVDMQAFFDRYVDGTEELELGPLLQRVGVKVETTHHGGPYTGLRLADGARVADVEVGSPAANAGFMRGDRLLAIDDRRADTKRRAQGRLDDAALGKPLTVTLFRRERLITRALTPIADPRQTWSLTLDTTADPSATALRQAWLKTQVTPNPEDEL